MSDEALRTAASGLAAASRAFQNSANNVANAGTVGRVDATDPSEEAFEPRDIQQVTTPGGGVATVSVRRDPATQTVFAPGSPLANDQGLVAAPNVDLGEELVNQIAAEAAFSANAAVIRSVDEQQDELLDIVS